MDTPIRTTRGVKHSYREESDSDTDLRPTPERVSNRATRQPQSYREPDSDEEISGNFFNQEGELQTDLSKLEAPSPTDSDGATRKSASRRPSKRVLRTTRSTPRKRHASISNSVSNRNSPAKKDLIIPIGKIPAWTTLPYENLVDIFKYAAYPLYDDTVQRTQSIQWLLNASRVCKAFFQPAMAALYYSPPLMPAKRCVGYLDLLSKDQTTTSMDYSNKIHRLDIAVPQILVKKQPHTGYIDVYDIIKSAQLVHHLHLYHDDDRLSAASNPISKITWKYPHRLFDALRDFEVVLQSFTWNARFGLLEEHDLLKGLADLHASHKSFKSIKQLNMINMFRSTGLYDEDAAADPNSHEVDQRFFSSLAALPMLESLCLMSSPIVDGPLMAKLPSSLRSLALVNCDNLSGDNLCTFLQLGGTQLLELRLDHNKMLDFSFLTILGDVCPHLCILKMDLTYYDKNALVIRDVDPHYDALLKPDEVPNWPRTLVDLELTQLRIAEAQIVEMFLNSLITAAPELNDLRRLILKVILKIGWRDRAKFRGNWVGMLEETFLRRAKPPKIRRSIPKAKNDPTVAATAESGGKVNGAEGQQKSPQKRQSTRIAQQIEEARNASTASDDDDDGAPAKFIANGEAKKGLQPMCDFVLIRIDNLRPAEAQFDEGDFMDSELSGDEDWNGD